MFIIVRKKRAINYYLYVSI